MTARDACGDLLPLRQHVALAGGGPGRFARQDVLDGLARPDCFRFVGHAHGGQIQAAGELALYAAQRVLRDIYGERLACGSVSVHGYRDPATQAVLAPVMFVRIDTPRAYAADIGQVLSERAATPGTPTRQRGRVVLRADIDLACALGLHRQVAELTDGAAHVLSWLVGYRPRGDAAACGKSAFQTLV